MRARTLLAAGALLSTPYWLPDAVVSLRQAIFARVNGEQGVVFPNDQVGPERFEEVYSHPRADGRSRGAALSDLFWYWLAPGPHIHQEHLEPGPRHQEVARATAAVLSGSSRELADAAARRTASVLDELGGGRARLVRLRDLMMPVWAEFFYERVFDEPCPPAARRLITGNAEDVVNALKCVRPRRMRRRHRLTRYLLRRIDAGEVAHPLPALLSRTEQAYWLQGTFFNTAVVQMSEAMAHLLLVLAEHRDLQARLAAAPDDDRLLGDVMDETLRLYPLFGVAHRIATDDIALGPDTVLPAGSVLLFDYPAYHASGHDRPELFDPSRWERLPARQAHHIPFGVAANRPCPAWRLAPLVMRAATREVLARYTLESAVTHTRSLPSRGPCLLVRRDAPLPRPLAAAARGLLRVRDRWEDVCRGPLQLLLGTYMVLDARRQRLAERYFDSHDDQGRPLGPTGGPTGGQAPGCPYAGGP
ncbi:cytochrome P450 [Streptomyces sp. NPDC092296]|uniref:cytochrome P450 n=1 Tax=Streptomyces sp. NPDC092296 TaxID=3366012 RepID=UPI0037F258E5